jgi:hypothetical protein
MNWPGLRTSADGGEHLKNFFAVDDVAGRERNPLVAEPAARPHPEGAQKGVG